MRSGGLVCAPCGHARRRGRERRGERVDSAERGKTRGVADRTQFNERDLRGIDVRAWLLHRANQIGDRSHRWCDHWRRALDRFVEIHGPSGEEDIVTLAVETGN